MQTNRLFQLVSAIAGLLSLAASPAYAGFDFSFFRLKTITQDFRGASIITDYEEINSPQNPVHTLQDTHLGPDFARTQFDVSWLEYTGIFDAEVAHHIADMDFVTATSLRLEFVPDRDLLVDVDFDIDYTSSGADLADITAGIGITDFTHLTGVGGHNFLGGAAGLFPPSGNFTFNEQYLLPAGSLYRIDLEINGDSGFIHSQLHAPINITGYCYVSIMPVPEPASILLLAFAGAVVLARPREGMPTLGVGMAPCVGMAPDGMH